ncbi:MAG: T9SS type A sorting domain-containing protein [Flavobacteriales bacterium]|nr:T9SS type A sorting domain-containing protein [Flavobacteriales bacterium]
MKILLSLIFIITLSNITFTQPIIKWEKSIGGVGSGDFAHSIQQTADGGFIVAGVSTHDTIFSNGDQDMWIVKLTNTGAVTWEKYLGGTSMDVAHSIQQTADGGYIVAGFSYSNDEDITGNNGGSDMWIVKLTSTGTITWEKSLGGTDYDFAQSIQQTTDGGYIVAGDSPSIDGDVTGNNGGKDMWIVKLTSTGTITWEKSLGGTSNDYAQSIQQTVDGGYIVAGYSSSIDGDVTGNNGDCDMWIVKLTSTGTITWEKSLGGTADDRASSIQQTVDGGYIVTGYSSSFDGDVSGSNGGSDMWIVKLTSTGTITWEKSLGGAAEDRAFSIQQTTDGGYIVAGASFSIDGDVTGNNGGRDMWIVKLTSTGTITWEKSLGGTADDRASSIQQTTDGGYIVAGDSYSNDGDVTDHHPSYGADYWVVKLNTCDVYSDYTYSNNNNGNYTFTNTSTGNFNKSHWSFGDGTTMTSVNPNHTFNANGIFPVVLTVNDSTFQGGACIDYYLDTINVTSVPTPAQCISGFVMYPDTSSNNIIVINSSMGNNITYMWNFGDSTTSTLQNPSHTYSTAGPFYLCLTIDDGNGCVDMYCDSIGKNGVVFNKAGGFTINIISPNTTGIDSKLILNSEIKIYPNPVSNQLSIDTELNISEIKIIDITGKMVMIAKEITHTINLADLSNGIYFIKVTTEEKTITKKFVKQ